MDFNRQKCRNLTKTIPTLSFIEKIDHNLLSATLPTQFSTSTYTPRDRSTTLDSGYELELAESEDSSKHALYRFPPIDPPCAAASKNTTLDDGKGTVDSPTIRRLSLVSNSNNTHSSELDGLSFGLRTRLRQNLQDTSRNSFANQVHQLSQPFPGLDMISSSTQWAAEISQPLSALYAILVVIISACLAFSAQLTSNVDSMYCRYFDSVLLFIGIIFLLAAFGCLYRKKSSSGTPAHKRRVLPFLLSPQSSVSTGTGSFIDYFRHTNSGSASSSVASISKGQNQPVAPAAITDLDSASFYLKMGALAFGIGSMIYACLELGVFVENTSCFNTIMGLNPVLFMVFVVLQLYFVFLNSQLTLRRYRTVGRFGLMHMVATNLCIWIRTLIDETLHAFGKIREKSEKMIFLDSNMTEVDAPTSGEEYAQIMEDSKQGKGGYNPLCVDDESVMKKMMEEASVFLYPCIIEYSMISAGIVYIMWTIIEQHPKSHLNNHHHTDTTHRSRKTSYAVDCHQAAKGLFTGIIIVVLTIVSLILYFIFLDKPNFTTMAVFQAQITEISLYAIGMLAVVFCFVQITRNLRRAPNHNISSMLDETLLKISMMGVYAYAVVSILGGFAEGSLTGTLSVVAASLCLIQSTAQTIFIFDASQRVLVLNLPKDEKPENHADTNKPARETVTLLLIVNFAMWATNVFCTLRQESSPSQTEFYGTHEWMVILHVTVPLVIFYRFHSTACLFEIWKRAYKIKRRHSTPAKVFPLTEYMTTA